MDQGGLPQDASGGCGLGQLQRLWLSRLPIRWPMSGQRHQSVSQGSRQFGQVRGLILRQIRRFANVLIYMIEFPLRVLVEVDRLPTHDPRTSNRTETRQICPNLTPLTVTIFRQQ